MATDVTRTSYDPARRYTGVVVQQGRISLDAEANEQAAITADERLREANDVIGPAGTPDDGYALSAGPGFDLTVGPGTMYVGGTRVHLDAPVRYGAQSEWLDADGDPRFTPVPQDAPDREQVLLELAEFAVSPTEDAMLREPGLGGVDGAARLRIVQRVRRLPTESGHCATALAGAVQAWAEEGLVFDPDTMRLESAGRLRVGFSGAATAPDPCDPGTAGGYLGAENQTIRVQVSGVDPGTGTFDLLWGWDNASFLYRVSADHADPPTLTLGRSPVDTHHQPRPGQAVQVLRAAASLTASDGEAEGWAAALTGASAVLTAPYDPDTRRVPLPAPLPAGYLDPDRTPQLYLRVWEGLVHGITPGDPVVLPGTGVEVRLTVPAGLPVHLGDSWSFAVRPATPDGVLPGRLLRAPQPPDGPRLWACPLAVIDWPGGSFQLLEDCRRHFPALTALTSVQGCCTVTVTPAQARGGGLQRIVDEAARNRPAEGRRSRVTVCLRPGRYELDQPLVLTRKHSSLHLEGCGEGVVLTAARDAVERFGQGMIILVGAEDVRISGIGFGLPLVPPDEQGPDAWSGVSRSIGVRPVHTQGITVHRCAFTFPTAPTDRSLFGAAVFAGSMCGDLVVTDTVFDRRGRVEGHARHEIPEPPPARQGLVGVLVSPSLPRDGADVPALLTDVLLRDNLFRGLSGAIALTAVRSGVQRIENNRAHACHGGIFIVSLPPSDLERERARSGRASAVDVLIAALQYPLPDQFTDPGPAHRPELPPSLMIRSNRVDCVPAPDDEAQSSGPALLILEQRSPDTDRPWPRAALVHDNHLTARLRYPVAVLEDVHDISVTVTGNVVSNLHPRSGERRSLRVDGNRSSTVVSGNVLVGKAELPGGPFPWPLDLWLPLNSVES
ncbi:DUF6519 domain-containing protein [Streptomyces sp. NPDC059985]|uniref:DUF6519 domain-containing protein n=1 Tax=Streptomyces sp. NPDC059985 TaxID=3347025 RepID=UPI0036C200D1